MICSACAHDNPDNAKFCLECGTPVERACPSCGTRLPPAAKFCVECGTQLGAGRSGREAAAPAAVRKRVTALFADLVGSTAFGEQVDPEAARSSLAPYFALLKSTVDDHAGSVIKFTGDGVLAVFGLPEVAEDDALRAVAAGVDLQRRFRSFADGIRDRHGIEVGLRIGVNTGELVIGDQDADLVGDVLNTAARLEAACAPGQVLVGEDTWRLTRSSVTYEVLGEVRVKGKAEPVATFQVIDAGSTRADVTPFVGRTAELAVLQAAFDDAVATSGARLVTVVGDPGVGKTRLAQELRLGTDARTFDVRLERRGSTTFAPIVDLLREAGAASAADVDRLVEGHPEAHRLGPLLASLLGHGDARTTEESFWAVRRLLEVLAAGAPVILVVDDIQWAEPLFWDLLEHLVEWTAAPVLLVALARPELRDLRPELTQPGRRVSATVALEGLDPDTTLELAARLLDIDQLPSELAERLPGSTDGNPLFVRELVQMLVDDGVLVRDSDHWRLTIDVDAIDVPPTILSLLASRVERLPDDERQVVELASVIGTEFDRGTLGALAGTDVAGHLGALVDRLRRKELIEPTGAWSGDDPVYRFHHVLIRDAAYRRLLKGHRAELHERVGRHIDAGRTDGDGHGVDVAFHFEQVHRYRTDLGAVDEFTRILAVEAAAHLRAAAESATEREDLASAGSYAIRALRLLGADAASDRAELLLIGCEALLSSADVTRGAPLVEELNGQQAEPRLRAWADCFRAQLWSLTEADRLTEAAELTADAAERLTALGDNAGVAKARLVRASCLARLGRVGDCEAELDLALGAARAAGDRRRTVAVLGAAPLAALWGPSPVARAGGRCLDVLRLLRITTASPTVEATSVRCQGMLEALRGRAEAARAKFEISRAAAKELGLRHGLYETELFAGLAELLDGDPVSAEPHLRAARDGLGRLGIGADAGQAAALLGRAVLLQGRLPEADDLATGALDTAGQNLQTAITARAVLAEIRAMQGRHGDARRLIDEAIAIVAPTDVTLDHALTRLAAARVAAAAGDRAGARQSTDIADALLSTKGVTAPLNRRIDPAPDTQPPNATGATRPTHPAWQVVHAALTAWYAGDYARVHALIGPDFRQVSHVALEGHLTSGVDRDDFVRAIGDFTSVAGGVDGTHEAVAVRGHTDCLFRMSVAFEGGRWNRTAVATVTDGAIRRLAWFDDDQLFDALAELDRAWAEHDPSAAPAASLAACRRLAQCMAQGDRDEIRAAVTDDFLALDHQGLGLGERRVEEWIGSSVRTATGDPLMIIPVDVLMGDERWVLARFSAHAGDDSWHVLNIAEIRDGRVSRIEHFGGDDIAAATARYRELAAGDDRSQRFTNTAWEVTRRTNRSWARRDPDAARSQLAPEFRAVWHDRLADGALEADRDTFVEILFAIDGDAEATHQDRLVALRGDHLALTWNRVEVEGAAQHVRYRVNESVGHQLAGIEWFDEHQLDEACAELDRRYLLSRGFPEDHWVSRAFHAIYATGADAMAPYVHPDVQFTEHRRFIQREGGEHALLTGAAMTGAGTAMVPQVFRLSEAGMVYERVEVEPDAPGELRMILSLGFADDAVRWVDNFDPDDLDAAVTLFDSRQGPRARDDGSTMSNTAWELDRRFLLGEGVAPDDTGPLEAELHRHDALLHAPRAPGEIAPNRAYLIADELGRATVRRDRDAMAVLLADDFEIDHRGSARAAMGVAPRQDRDGIADHLLQTAVEEGVHSLARRPIAIRGDDLYLATSTLTTGDGDELVNYALGQSAGGRLWRMTYFDESQLDEALDELDRRYRLERGVGDDHWLARNWPSLTSFDPDWYDTILAADFEAFDHRSVALRHTGRNEFLGWLRATPATSVWSIPVFHRLSDRAMVVEHIETWADAAAVTHLLLTVDLRGGSARRMDGYELADLDAALARYDEIMAEPHDGSTLTNHAWTIAHAAWMARLAGDREGVAALVADAFVHRPHDALMATAGGGEVGKSLYLDGAFDTLTTGATTTAEAALVAVRGDDLCLFRSRTTTADGDVYERIIVVEASGTQLIRSDSYAHDQLGEAQTELDRRWLAGLGYADDHPWHDLVARFYVTDSAVIAAAFADDFRYVEHRKLGFPDGGRDQLITNQDTLHDLGPMVVEVIIPRYLRLTDRLALGERIEQSAGGFEEGGGLYVTVFGDQGLIEYMEVFELGDDDAALVCVDRLEAELDRGTPSAPAVPPLTNRAWELGAALSAAYTAGDRYEMARLMDPDGGVESRRQLDVQGTVAAPDFIDFRLAVRPAADDGRREVELLAVRGDHHCLLMVDRWLHGDRVRLAIVVETDDDRVTHMVWFDEDQLVDAQVELDRRWLESIGRAGHWYAPYFRDLYDPHPDGMFAYLTADFVYVDHRPLMFPDGDAEQLRVNIHSMEQQMLFVVPRIHALSDAGAVVERLELAVDEVAQTHVLFVGRFAGELIQRLEAFDITQLDAALARYEELTGETGHRRPHTS